MIQWTSYKAASGRTGYRSSDERFQVVPHGTKRFELYDTMNGTSSNPECIPTTATECKQRAENILEEEARVAAEPHPATQPFPEDVSGDPEPVLTAIADATPDLPLEPYDGKPDDDLYSNDPNRYTLDSTNPSEPYQEPAQPTSTAGIENDADPVQLGDSQPILLQSEPMQSVAQTTPAPREPKLTVEESVAMLFALANRAADSCRHIRVAAFTR